jgi:hypothetical protein
MPLVTAKPTLHVPWPTILLAGEHGAGKTYAALETSASDLIDRTLVLTLGENEPDEYGSIPGARFERIVHDGTYEGVLEVVEELHMLPAGRKPNLFVLDGGTALWDLIVNNKRAIARRQSSSSRAPFTGDLGNELWSEANADWTRVLSLINRLPGPAIITARMDGKKIRSHRDLAYEVSGVIELPERGVYRITSLKSARSPLAGVVELDELDIARIWQDMGLPKAAGPVEYATAQVSA